MQLGAATGDAYLSHAFAELLAVADRVGDRAANERPLGPGTNSIAALVVHCCGVVEFWLGHVALGEPSGRDRDAEFTATASTAELHALVDATVERARTHLRRLEVGEGTEEHSRPDLLGGATDDAVVLHVLEELYQHLGHAEVTADALAAGGEP